MPTITPASSDSPMILERLALHDLALSLSPDILIIPRLCWSVTGAPT